jgi:hypothetical protein
LGPRACRGRCTAKAAVSSFAKFYLSSDWIGGDLRGSNSIVGDLLWERLYNPSSLLSGEIGVGDRSDSPGRGGEFGGAPPSPPVTDRGGGGGDGDVPKIDSAVGWFRRWVPWRKEGCRSDTGTGTRCATFWISVCAFDSSVTIRVVSARCSASSFSS